MNNSKMRIISLWSDMHGIFDYYNTGPYGKFFGLNKVFVNSFNKLYSRNDVEIRQGLQEVFGPDDPNHYDATTFKLHVYELFPLNGKEPNSGYATE